MTYFTEYDSELIGMLILQSDGQALTGCWFEHDRLLGYAQAADLQRKDDLPVFDQTRNWLDRYFAGQAPSPEELPLAAKGSSFQHRVWDILSEIPYGSTVTYGDIAKQIAHATGKKMSAQAVGGAVGHNPICVIVPCHRVMGPKGNLTGFGGGLDTKIKLLQHENVNMEGFYRPKKGTAL